MRILHISPSYYPATRFGGPIQSVHLLNKAIVKKGVNVDVITTSAGVSKTRMDVWMNECMKEDGWYHFDGIRAKYLDYIGYEHYNFSLPLAKEIREIMKNYDLVHITAVWNFPVLAGSILSIIKKKPFIISTRGTIYHETIALKSTIWKKIYYFFFAKHYLNKATAIHFTSEDEKERVIGFLKLKTPSFIVPNGIDLNEIGSSDQKSEISIKGKYILFLGRIDRKKGFDLLIPAFANVIKEYNDLYLVIAGNQSTTYKHTIIQLIQKYNLSDKVIFTGEVTGIVKWSLYKNAIMFVLPSYSENFGMSIVEAMACGCPVIISDKVGIFRDVQKARAGIIVHITTENVEEGIRKLLVDEKLRQNISSNALKLVWEKFDIEKVADQMIEVYERILR